MNAPTRPDKNSIHQRVKIAANGRMVVPKALRDAVGIKGETDLVLSVEDGQIRISTVADRVRHAQELFRKAVKHDFTSDEFLATRERD